MISQIPANSQLFYMLMTRYLFCSDITIQSLKKKHENEFGLFEKWINSNQLTLNYSKIQNRIIISKIAVRFLEVMQDHKLTWKDHTRHVDEKL